MASNATIVGESSQENLNRKRANVSAVWQYVEKQDTEGQSKCLLCKTIVKHLSKTSNLAKVIYIMLFHLNIFCLCRQD